MSESRTRPAIQTKTTEQGVKIITMKSKQWIAIGIAASVVAVLTALAAPISAGTFRDTASVGAVFQVPNPIATNTALLAFDTFAGHDLVNLALGDALTTVQTNRVLALEISCDSTSARLVVFDTGLLSNIVDIAGSTNIYALTGQDSPALVGPTHERFVMRMAVNTNGFLVGGFLTVAGRVYLNPTNGCPRAVLVDTDRAHDGALADAAVKDLDDKVKDKEIAGEAHLIGVANVIFEDGSTNVTLLPFGQMTLRRQLLP
jgi:hypothetical protein